MIKTDSLVVIYRIMEKSFTLSIGVSEKSAMATIVNV